MKVVEEVEEEEEEEEEGEERNGNRMGVILYWLYVVWWGSCNQPCEVAINKRLRHSSLLLNKIRLMSGGGFHFQATITPPPSFECKTRLQLLLAPSLFSEIFNPRP
jgi:hypothetical protein